MRSILIEKIIKKSYYSYHVQKLFEDDNIKMEVLGDWFVFDVSNNPATWIKWLNDRDKLAEDTESNATWLEKEWLPDGKCNVTFGSIVDLIQDKAPIYVPDPARILIMPRENVIELLKTWKKLLEIRPNQIMITEENGVYKMFEVQ